MNEWWERWFLSYWTVRCIPMSCSGYSYTTGRSIFDINSICLCHLIEGYVWFGAVTLAIWGQPGSKLPTNLISSSCNSPRKGVCSWILCLTSVLSHHERGKHNIGRQTPSSDLPNSIITCLLETWSFYWGTIFSFLKVMDVDLYFKQWHVQVPDCMFKADEVSLWHVGRCWSR